MVLKYVIIKIIKREHFIHLISRPVYQNLAVKRGHVQEKEDSRAFTIVNHTLDDVLHNLAYQSEFGKRRP
jgi:hypothetical protein